MKKYLYPPKEDWQKILARPAQDKPQLEALCAEIFNNIRANGDKALMQYTLAYDKVQLKALKVSEEELAAAENEVSEELKEAIRLAAKNIETFHKVQIPYTYKVANENGFTCWQEIRPIEKIGLYIPGGSAPLFSTVLMLAIPARIAECERVILCSPPNKDGKVNPAILWAARLCGVKEVYKVGGIQAIAAMTFGTETIPQVYKILGPGSSYVTTAKRYATGFGIAIDMPAGPSEVMVVADKSSNPKYVAADLLSQAEHGADSQVVLVTWTPEIFEAVQQELSVQLKGLPRMEIARAALENSKYIAVHNADTAMDIANEYAPEHLILAVESYKELIPLVKNAGSVFLGSYSPESAGDYASGTNHTLPTGGYAKAYSGVGVETFLKRISFQEISPKGLSFLGQAVEAMAEGEGLFAHKNAVSIRLNDLP